MKNYKVNISIWGTVLFLAVILPNLIWFVFPAPNDILRTESRTQFIDTIALVCQILFVAAICILVNRNSGPLRRTPLTVGMIGCIILYYSGWLLYYLSFTNLFIILLLTVPPCGAFLLFAIDRRNYIALIPAVIFSTCHLFYAVVNFMVR